jgi:3-hydroxybutyryl-CoA dehydrogenase
VNTAAVIGSGVMGAGIAEQLARSEVEVVIVDVELERAERAAEAAAGAGGAGASAVSSIADLPLELDLLIEAVPERLDLKRAVLADAECRRPRLLATNTSALSIEAMAGALSHPERFCGLHFFNPVTRMELVEVVLGPATSATTARVAAEWVRRISKTPIVVRDSPGFVTSRLGLALGLEAMRMVEEGVAEAQDIDQGMELGYRHPMGPLRLTDLVGLDVRRDIAVSLAERLGPRFRPPDILERMVAEGRLGKKAGRGFYEW